MKAIIVGIDFSKARATFYRHGKGSRGYALSQASLFRLGRVINKMSDKGEIKINCLVGNFLLIDVYRGKQ